MSFPSHFEATIDVGPAIDRSSPTLNVRVDDGVVMVGYTERQDITVWRPIGLREARAFVGMLRAAIEIAERAASEEAP